jgi:hypothetical protein
MKDPCETLVRGVCHFVAVGFGIATGLMRVRRVAVKESVSRVVAENDFVGGCVFDLDTLKPLHDLRETLDTTQPA